MVTIQDYFYDEYVERVEHIMPTIRNYWDMDMDIDKDTFWVEGLNDYFAANMCIPILKKEKSVHLSKHRPKKLPDHLLGNLKIIQEASKENPLKILETKDEQFNFIKQMEKVWGRTTQEHIYYMKNKGFEGNVDERTWYRTALQLKKIGVLKDLEV
ncbi:hypothetical protein MKX47_00970 [Solibacillus sp. FSL R7-0668]|uniref:hypothetical protein n=1 Tax=Solibacillus sp. FSL R7-0668 TaxID=2921688 RepID=UPI0030F62C0D